MITKLQKWGNSQGVRIPKQVLDEVSLSEGDSVDISVNENTIIIKRLNSLKKYTLEELFAENHEKTDEIDWGKPVGKEEW